MYKLIKRLIRIFLSNIWMDFQYLFMHKNVVLSKTRRNIILFGIPNYSNLGDQAIVIAEQKFIKDKFPNANLIMIPETDTAVCLWKIKSAVTNNDLIIYQGGGNLGSLYPSIERRRRFLIRKMKKQKIVIFPQSIFFEDNLVGNYERRLSSKTYNDNPNLVLAVRERYSLNMAAKFFSTTKCILVPDIVFYLVGMLDSKKVKKPFRRILLVLRDDDEGCLTSQFKAKLISSLEKRFELVRTTDTMDHERSVINRDNRMDLLDEKWSEFTWADVVVTDRLHGTLFSILTRRPCLVFANNNHKIESTISTWLKNSETVKLVNEYSIEKVENIIDGLESRPQDSYIDMRKKYFPLIKSLQ
ncbi:polysaccharide pyruvyl transferase family protein [Lactiplantibacillus plantarum]|uniref:polysaccharide pyruvyl transferase family protein n=1 Tax=Lactiplantibacillus plantarum TaxID=1590 RepID=UPI00093277D0|nr:polysaccharide pyruvyl transferase family protein [Lactiplantibacillus plantarum]MCW6118566.1 polysaccharide pyruvyl transferase family protein [Lactiplantibacillus plantarum]QHM48064.1 General stress protein 30 [Lactiplantibacillus plantarum]